jgi:hypothetical protein
MYVKFIYIAHLSCKHATNDAEVPVSSICCYGQHNEMNFVDDEIAIVTGCDRTITKAIDDDEPIAIDAGILLTPKQSNRQLGHGPTADPF